MLALMDTMMGGRAAEELVFGPDKVTTGASNDLRVSFFCNYIYIIFIHNIHFLASYHNCN